MTDMIIKTDAQIKANADPRVLHPLEQLRGTIRRFVILDGLLAVGLFFIAWFWGGLLLDFGLFKITGFDWVMDAPRALRAVTSVALLVLLASVLFRRVYHRLKSEFSYPSLALVLEKRFPKILGDRLITAVELSDIDRAKAQGYSEMMVRRTIDEAREIVSQVPVDTVFNWSRLRSKLITGCSVMVGLVILSWVLFGAVNLKTASVGEAFAPDAFASKFSDVTAIWTERNLFLLNTPWPRRAHLELIAFPENGLRLPKGNQSAKLLAPGADNRPPRIRARAYRYVMADRSVKAGWRPVKWGTDLGKFVNGVSAPHSITVLEEGDWSPLEVSAAGLCGSTAFPGAGFPAKKKTIDLDTLSVDEVYEQFRDSHEAEFGPIFDALDKSAARLSMSRTLRKLEIPTVVTLNYRGKPIVTASGAQTVSAGRTSGEIHLNTEPNGEYSTDVTPFKESVGFTLRAEDFRTDVKDVLLVNPPMMTKLSHVDYQPAYLYHPAPTNDAGKNDNGEPNFQLLKGLRQVMPEKDLSLTGDKSVCSVPSGTDLILTAVADKPLKAAYMIPKSGLVPGGTEGKTDPVEIKDRKNDTVVIVFKGAARIEQTVDFDLVLVDEDNVESVRPVLIQAVEDQPPQVDVMVDVLRKVGPNYYCTPRAQVPFVANSMIKDDNGLSNVKFVFTVTKVESNAMLAMQVNTMATMWAFAPVVGNFGSLIGPAVGSMVTLNVSKNQMPQGRAVEMKVQPFDRAYSDLRPDTLKILLDKVSKPLENPDDPHVVRRAVFSFVTDVLDLEEADRKLESEQKRKMRVEGFNDYQPKHRIDLRIVAKDTNVETGPKEGQSIEPIRLMVVSEADLLMEISKDEDQLILKLDEAISKLKNARSNWNTWRDRLASSSMSDQDLRAATTRVEDMNLDINKSRDNCQTANGEFNRLRREMEVNKIAWEQDDGGVWGSRNAKKYDKDIIKPMEALLSGEFKSTEEAMVSVRAALAENKTPGEQLTRNTSEQLTGLIEKLEAIKAGFGEALSMSKLKLDLQMILQKRKELKDAEDDLERYLREKLTQPVIAMESQITLTTGVKQKIKTSVDWKAFDKEKMLIKFEAAPEGLLVPNELEIKDEGLDFELTGTKPGEYIMKMTPFYDSTPVGKSVNVKVSVK